MPENAGFDCEILGICFCYQIFTAIVFHLAKVYDIVPSGDKHIYLDTRMFFCLLSPPGAHIGHHTGNTESVLDLRNMLEAYLLESKDIIKTDVEETLKFYTKLCSLNVTAESLANFGKILASDGVCTKTGKRYLSGRTVRIVKTLMLTCGMYDGSGTYAITVGIPTKSGVGGGLLCVSDKRAGIGVFGPALDKQGNSIAGIKLLESISQRLRLNLFYDPDWDDVTHKEELI